MARTLSRSRSASKRRPSLRPRGGARHKRRRTSSRPRFMHFRWWLVLRSPRAQKAGICLLAVTVVALVLFRRAATQDLSPPAPPSGAGPAG